MTERLARWSPHWLAASLCLGLSLADGVRVRGASTAGLGVALALLAVLVGGRLRPPLVALALVLGGWSWGSARLDSLDQSALRSQIGSVEPATVVVTGPARHSAFGLRVPIEVRRFGSLAAREPALLELPVGRSPPQGAVLELIATVRHPRGPDDGFDEGAWLRRRGVHVVLRSERFRQVGRRGGLGGLTDRIRSTLARTLAPGVRGERRAVLEGMVLGDEEGLSTELRQRFRTSGFYHLLAVSGSNVAIVAGSVLIVAWLLGISRLLAEVGALAAIGGYVLAVGAQPSVVRAGIAGALGSLAWLAARERDRWWFLLVGAICLLAWNPYALLDAGFQLSFAAVAAIFTLVPPLLRRLEGYPVPRPVAGTLAVATACSLVTAPILWLQFGSVPVYSVLANALAAPAVPPLLWLALASVGLHSLLPGVAAALGWLNGWLAAYVAGCARLVAGLPGARLPPLAALGIPAAAALAMAVLVKLPPRRRRAAAGLSVLALTLAAAGCSLWPRTALPPPTGLRITFLDVGQGDSALLQVPEGAVLVDEGPPEARVDRQLSKLGVRSLSLVVLTHPQRDHVGGAALVLGGEQVGAVLDPRIPADSTDERAALSEARRHGVNVVTARAGLTFRLGRLHLRVVWPDSAGSPGEDPNQHAIVLLASYGQVDTLLTADAESDVLLPLHLPPVEILKVSHHGSADAGLPELLQDLRPRVAVISVGAHNDYGHPTPSTLADLAAAPGLALYRTDLDGRVVVESDGRRLRVRTRR